MGPASITLSSPCFDGLASMRGYAGSQPWSMTGMIAQEALVCFPAAFFAMFAFAVIISRSPPGHFRRAAAATWKLIFRVSPVASAIIHSSTLIASLTFLAARASIRDYMGHPLMPPEVVETFFEDDLGDEFLLALNAPMKQLVRSVFLPIMRLLFDGSSDDWREMVDEVESVDFFRLVLSNNQKSYALTCMHWPVGAPMTMRLIRMAFRLDVRVKLFGGAGGGSNSLVQH